MYQREREREVDNWLCGHFPFFNRLNEEWFPSTVCASICLSQSLCMDVAHNAVPITVQPLAMDTMRLPSGSKKVNCLYDRDDRVTLYLTVMYNVKPRLEIILTQKWVEIARISILHHIIWGNVKGKKTKE